MVRFSQAKNNALSELLRDIGSIFFATLFIGPFITKDTNPYLVTFGFILSVISWVFGIGIIKD